MTQKNTRYNGLHVFKPDPTKLRETPDSLIDSLMGHKTYKPKCGKGPSLELKEMIAFHSPERL